MSARHGVAAVFFVASPLHYLAALAAARAHEAGSRRIVVPYRPDARRYVRADDWDGVAYAPWPRFEPLPGLFGRHRRLLANLDTVAAAVGHCDTLHLHSPVYDTEAINYFLRALPRRCRAGSMHARILPDGVLNLSRHPLDVWRRGAQHLRRLRRLVSPELDYWCFSGDRIGSDAPFVDRIYTLAGFPHPYAAEKVVELPPLARRSDAASSRAALVIGQPLVGIGALAQHDHDEILAQIENWLATNRCDEVFYKAHPRDPRHELKPRGATELQLEGPLELHLAQKSYQAIIGVNSTALVLARQICGDGAQILSFGNERVRFADAKARAAILDLIDRMNIRRL
ncbi:hypothetical protein CLD22_06745 [Rubrivivax gelatinosus]|nr:hypothetical protein [Rubrivivax gelatinosus]